jgi:eukaryotic-like serine/threonine-protein kinase
VQEEPVDPSWTNEILRSGLCRTLHFKVSAAETRLPTGDGQTSNHCTDVASRLAMSSAAFKAHVPDPPRAMPVRLPRAPVDHGMFRPGSVLASRFRIGRLVGRGGMGEVYEAFDLKVGTRIALKAIRHDLLSDRDSMRRFRREVRMMQDISHPSVCRIGNLYEHSGRDGRVPFFTMEFIDGETLGDRLNREVRLPYSEILPIATAIAQALDAVHRAGIIHRDLKSSNVLLGHDGRVVVTDFGLAKYALAVTNVTRGSCVGSPPYVAPELVEGRDASPASDIFSFGVLLYEMLTGTWPFLDAVPTRMVVKRLKHPPEPLERHLPTIDKTWRRVVMNCLSREPNARYPFVLDVVDALNGRRAIARALRDYAGVARVAAFSVCAVSAIGYLLTHLR